MASAPLPGVIRQVRRFAGGQRGCALTDAELLEAFVLDRDEASFEVLVWRHATMVLSLCQRVLRDSHEAEDAFQAAFLVLARKAGSIGKRESVASWLWKVAYRIALRMRARRAKGRDPATALDDLPARESGDDVLWRDLRPVLDEEIACLPEKYRAPFVLCHLEGHTNEEAAEQLGCPRGTVLSRLSRGRERLRARLERRGIALSMGWLAVIWSQHTSAAPAALASTTIEAAIPFAAGKAAAGLVSASVAALTEGVLHTMFLTKLKIVTAALVALVVLGSGSGWLVQQVLGQRPGVDRQATDRRGGDERAAGDRRGDGRERVEEKGDLTAGTVIAVSADGKTITVEVPAQGGRGRERSEVVEAKKIDFRIGDKTAVTYSGVGPDGAKATKGYRVNVRQEKDAKEALSVSFWSLESFSRRPADIAGRVVAVSKDGQTITVEVNPRGRGRDAEVQRFDVKLTEKPTIIFYSISPGKAAITEGYHADVWLEEGSKDTARKVVFSGTAYERQRDGAAPTGTGRVIEVSKDGNTLTVEEQPRARGEEPKKTDVVLGEKTVVSFNHVPPDGAKATKGMTVSYWSEGGKEAARASFTGTVRERDALTIGKVVGISKDGKTITIEVVERGQERGAEPRRMDVTIGDKTRVSYNGIGPNGAKPTEGFVAYVYQAEGAPAATGVEFYKQGAQGGRRERR
jgi:RNA polymerase sigma factor (sigma-70 family)